MKAKLDIIIGVDPGISGALTILVGEQPAVFDIPIIENKVKKGGKNKVVKEYDLHAIYKLLKPFEKQKVLLALEKVSSMPGEGTVSSFNFGQGFMLWKMASVCCGFDLVLVRPSVWKKAYPELSPKAEKFAPMKEEVKALRKQYKTMKKNNLRKEIKKEIDAINRKIKRTAKDISRKLASDFYPDLAEQLKLKKHDGRAESLLIAKYAKENRNELV